MIKYQTIVHPTCLSIVLVLVLVQGADHKQHSFLSELKTEWPDRTKLLGTHMVQDVPRSARSPQGSPFPDPIVHVRTRAYGYMYGIWAVYACRILSVITWTKC